MRPLISIPVPEGENEYDVWLRHEVAAIGEGLCPFCSARLQPIETPKGMGGRCGQHGIFHADPSDTTGWEMVCQWVDEDAMRRWRSKWPRDVTSV